jgi:hypothetical protein
LATLAHSTFQLLYDHVANGSIHVAFQLNRGVRIDNFKVVLLVRQRCKESLVATLDAPEGSLATLIFEPAGFASDDTL